MSLFWRIFLLNATVLTAATVILLLGPITVSTPVLLTEALVLAGGVAAMLLANGFLVRVGLAPLDRLTRAMTTVDLLRPGHRLAATGQAGIAELITTFNTMLDRLEAERASSSARALSAQEAERSRIARELHDEIGQSLTAVLLEVKRVADRAPAAVGAELGQVQEDVRHCLDEIRRIARRLRPAMLEELGLPSALKALTHDFNATGFTIRRAFDNDLPALPPETELVVYRVAQESLTNAARHASATRVDLALRRTPDGLELCVRDDGQGMRAPGAEGAGIRGMRERALLIGAKLDVTCPPAGGTMVRLKVPTRDGPDSGLVS